MPKRPIPIPLAMVVCDTVIDDRRTGKKSIVGIFNIINAKKVPCMHPRLNVFLSLTEGNGDYSCLLSCVSMDGNKKIFEMKGPIRFLNPHQIVEFNFEIAGIRFPDYGDYRFEFYCENELVIARKMCIIKPQQPKMQ